MFKTCMNLKEVEHFFGAVVKFVQETSQKVHQFEKKALKLSRINYVFR